MHGGLKSRFDYAKSWAYYHNLAVQLESSHEGRKTLKWWNQYVFAKFTRLDPDDPESMEYHDTAERLLARISGADLDHGASESADEDGNDEGEEEAAVGDGKLLGHAGGQPLKEGDDGGEASDAGEEDASVRRQLEYSQEL